MDVLALEIAIAISTIDRDVNGLVDGCFPGTERARRDFGVAPEMRKRRELQLSIATVSAGTGHLVQLLATKMGRHGRPSGIELPVKVGELAAGILQEKEPAQSEEEGGEIEKKDCDCDQDRRKIMLEEQQAVGS
jgi:hypothetical protein